MSRVLEVALRQLADKGFSALSVPEVAAEAGVNKTSVYRRWPTKSHLVRAALGQSMTPSATPPDLGDLRSDVLALVRAAVEAVQSPLGLAALRALLADGADPEVHASAGAMLRAREAGVPRQVLQRAIERGELPAQVDVSLVLSVIAGAVMHRVVVEQRRASNDFLVKLVELVLEGARRAPGARSRRPTPGFARRR